MIDYSTLYETLGDSALKHWHCGLHDVINEMLSTKRHGDLTNWLNALDALPNLQASIINLKSQVSIGSQKDCSVKQRNEIETQLRRLTPWRKGPFTVFDINIDTEWRSDFKWNRVINHIAPLADRTVLDVGCGNGYHCWRMLGEGAKRVIGIDPSPRFVVQFYMLKHFVKQTMPIDVLPLGIEHLPQNSACFDTTFSMGVFYHRRSPMDHLKELKSTLRSGGELVLDTLIIEGKLGEVLVPEDRYAMMKNVWFLPSQLTLESWLRKSGYNNIRCVDINQTSITEQRRSSWMPSHSLANFLDPTNPNLTVEGHPAPKRAVFIANK